jgi:DNA-binding transcriptional LysR family regulator
MHDPFGLVCRADHPLAAETGPVRWRELAGHTFLGLGHDTGIRPLVQSVDGLPDNLRQPEVEVSNIATLEGMLIAGLGISVLPHLAMPDHHANDLVFRPLVEPELARDICLITRQGRSLSPAAESMRDMVIARLSARARA